MHVCQRLGNHSRGIIYEGLYQGTTPRRTEDVYPSQERPSIVALRDWRQTIRASFLCGARTMGAYERQQVHSQDSQSPQTQTFQAYLRTQPSSVLDLIGPRLLALNEMESRVFATALQLCQGISIYGDGSVKDRRGAHVTRIYGS